MQGNSGLCGCWRTQILLPCGLLVAWQAQRLQGRQ
jgi:hypothetical protein